MPEPYNYLANIPNPAASLTAGLQTGMGLAQQAQQMSLASEQADMLAQYRAAQIQQEEAQTAKLRSEMERQQAFQGEVAKLAKEGFTTNGLVDVMTRFPDMAKQLEKPYEALGAEQRKQSVEMLQPVVAALNSGDRVNAAMIMDEKIDALRNAGKEREAAEGERQRDMILHGDLNAAQTRMNSALAIAMGPEKYKETFGALEDERRKRMLEESTNLKEYSDAKIAEAKAEFAKLREQYEVDKLKPKPVGVGGAAAKPALSMKDQLNVEGKLRDDFNSAMKPITEMSYSFQRLNASQDDAAGDLALIFNYMKMLDPGSAVREGEFANAQNAAGVPDQIRNQFNRLMGGERLNPGQRKSFKEQAFKIYEPYKKQSERLRTTYTSEAKRIGIDPSAIFLSAPQEETEKPAQQPGPVSTQAQPMATQAGPAMTPAAGAGGWSIVNVTKGK